MRNYEEIIDELFGELVPMRGAAPTVAGELVRAVCKIGYRFNNDGDHLGVDYGKETVNGAGRFLLARGDEATKRAVNGAWGVRDDDLYEDCVFEIERAVVEYIEAHPELKETANAEDMFDFSTDEDVWEDEEDDFGYWGDEDPLYDEDDDYEEDYYEGW